MVSSDFMDVVHQGEIINSIINPNISIDNTFDILGNALKILTYGLGGITEAGLNVIINSKLNQKKLVNNNF